MKQISIKLSLLLLLIVCCQLTYSQPNVMPNPQNATVCPGVAHSFNSSAAGASQIQWERTDNITTPNWMAVTAMEMIFTNMAYTTNVPGYYRARIKGMFSGNPYDIYSSVAQLSNKTAPSITSQPVGGVYGNVIQLSVTATGSGTLSYQWYKGNSPNATSSSCSVTGAGSYYVAVSDDNCTTNSDSVSINKATPVITLTTKNTDYTGLTIAIATPVITGSPTASTLPVTYEYSGSGASYGPSATPPTNSGNYSVTASTVGDDNHNQVTSAAVSLTINKATPVITLTPKSSNYTGAPVVLAAPVITGSLTASALPVTYLYVGTGNTTYGPSATPPTDPGSYSVTVSTVGDANHNAASASTVLSISAIPAKTTEITGQPKGNHICSGGSHTFAVEAEGTNLQYQWYKGNIPVAGATDSEYTIANATPADYEQYYVTVKGDDGQTLTSDKAVLWVANPLPSTLSFETLPGTVITGQNYTIRIKAYEDVTAYVWSYSAPGVSFSSSSGRNNEILAKFSAVAVGTGTLSVELTHACGNRTVTAPITVQHPTGIESAETSEIHLYPNPVADELQIENEGLAIKQVIVADINGRIISNTQPNATHYRLSASGWAKGVYFVRITTTEGTTTHKMIKK